MTNAVYIKTPTKPNSYTYSYYQNDHLGTPQQLLSFNSATVWQGEYDAFGEISITNNQIPQPLRFAGQYHDSGSNLYYNWHRYYNPKLGRYISSDPIGLDGGMNRFGYVGGNSLIQMDYSGLRLVYPSNGSRGGRPNYRGEYSGGKQTSIRPIRLPDGNLDPLSNLPPPPTRCNLPGASSSLFCKYTMKCLWECDLGYKECTDEKTCLYSFSSNGSDDILRRSGRCKRLACRFLAGDMRSWPKCSK